MALQSLEECEGRSLLLMDKYHVSPAEREALGRLAAMSEVRRRVRVIGLAAWDRPEESAALIDDVNEMPFTVETLLETIEAHVRRGSGAMRTMCVDLVVVEHIVRIAQGHVAPKKRWVKVARWADFDGEADDGFADGEDGERVIEGDAVVMASVQLSNRSNGFMSHVS